MQCHSRGFHEVGVGFFCFVVLGLWFGCFFFFCVERQWHAVTPLSADLITETSFLRQETISTEIHL